VARVELGGKTILQLSRQVAIDADREAADNDMTAQADFIMDNITAILATLFRERATVAAWRSRPSWYAISRQDRTISPELERFFAERINATTVEIDSGQLSPVTHPQQITQLILDAARAASE
jgi:pimeloyl-ACP methyl ester carboxylesterase